VKQNTAGRRSEAAVAAASIGRPWDSDPHAAVLRYRIFCILTFDPARLAPACARARHPELALSVASEASADAALHGPVRRMATTARYGPKPSAPRRYVFALTSFWFFSQSPRRPHRDAACRIIEDLATDAVGGIGGASGG